LKKLEQINRNQLRKFKEKKRKQQARLRSLQKERIRHGHEYLHVEPYEEEENWIADSDIEE
ncbi:MAG: hypothetical protein V2I33_23150, partial [Kangiellaceae bacterium]|nr:hypothetical protein [Kangiellaceae bacterium]